MTRAKPSKPCRPAMDLQLLWGHEQSGTEDRRSGSSGRPGNETENGDGPLACDVTKSEGWGRKWGASHLAIGIPVHLGTQAREGFIDSTRIS